MTGALMVNVAYGVEPTTFEHPYIMLSENTSIIADAVTTPGEYLVDLFPLRESCSTP